jgi:hypothetical protein
MQPGVPVNEKITQDLTWLGIDRDQIFKARLTVAMMFLHGIVFAQ